MNENKWVSEWVRAYLMVIEHSDETIAWPMMCVLSMKPLSFPFFLGVPPGYERNHVSNYDIIREWMECNLSFGPMYHYPIFLRPLGRVSHDLSV